MSVGSVKSESSSVTSAGTNARSQKAGRDFSARVARSEENSAERDQRVTRSDTRARLMVAALELFSQNGFDATTMRDLAAFAGIKAPAIYNHFSSKEALLGEALLWAMDDFNTAVISPADGVEDSVAALNGILSRHVRYQLDNPTIANAFDILASHSFLERLGESAAQKALTVRLRHYQRTLTAAVSDILKRSGDELEVRTVAHAIATMYDQVVRWYRPGTTANDTLLIDSYWELTKRMLRLTSE